MGVFVYMKNPKRKLNIIWALMSLSVGLWGIGLALMASAHTGIEATSYLKWLHYFGAIFIPIFYFHFVTIILRVEHKNRLIIYLGYIICIFLQFMSFNGQLAGVRENIDIFRYYTVPKSFYLFFTVYFFGYVIYGIFLLFEYFLRAVGGTKHQIKYVLISSIIGFIGGSTTFLLVFDIPIHCQMRNIFYLPLILLVRMQMKLCTHYFYIH
ncbi:MAG: hypothetical protein KJ983_00250 [Candidatus Omnitrophica bacterium]|nr:hypothetical protein [Candidatus Omnitrophota bacterium]